MDVEGVLSVKITIHVRMVTNQESDKQPFVTSNTSCMFPSIVSFLKVCFLGAVKEGVRSELSIASRFT